MISSPFSSNTSPKAIINSIILSCYSVLLDSFGTGGEGSNIPISSISNKISHLDWTILSFSSTMALLVPSKLNIKQIRDTLDDSDLGAEEDSSFDQKFGPKSGGVNIFIFAYVPWFITDFVASWLVATSAQSCCDDAVVSPSLMILAIIFLWLMDMLT